MFIVERSSLLAAVEAVLPLAGPGAVATVAAEEPDALTVTAARPGQGVRSVALGRVLLAGSVALPIGPLVRALRCGAGSCRVEVATNGTTAAVAIDPDGPTARKFVFQIDAPAAAPPPWPEGAADDPTATLPAVGFIRAVERGAFAAVRRSPYAPGWATEGVEVGIGPGGLTLASTDGLRLAVATCAGEARPRGKERTALVPPATVRAWAVAAKRAETVRLTLGDGHVLFEAGTAAAWAAPLAGTFPPWRTGMPVLPNAVTVPAGRFRTEVEAAVAVADPHEPRVTLATRPGGLTLTASAGAGRVVLKIPVAGFKGPAVEVPLDGRRLLEVLKAYRGAAALTLGYGTGTQPVAVSAGEDCRCHLAPAIERDRSEESHR